jgi:hypothetical protein
MMKISMMLEQATGGVVWGIEGVLSILIVFGAHMVEKVQHFQMQVEVLEQRMILFIGVSQMDKMVVNVVMVVVMIMLDHGNL